MTNKIIFPAISSNQGEFFLNGEIYQCRKFLATEEMLTKTFRQGIRGVRADGQVYWLVDGRIFFEMKEPIQLEGQVYTTQTSEGDFSFQVIQADRLYSLYEKNEYSDSTSKMPTIKSRLYPRTSSGVKEATAASEKKNKEKKELLISRGLVSLKEEQYKKTFSP